MTEWECGTGGGVEEDEREEGGAPVADAERAGLTACSSHIVAMSWGEGVLNRQDA